MKTNELKDLDMDKLMEQFNIEEFEDMQHPGTIIRKSDSTIEDDGTSEDLEVEVEETAESLVVIPAEPVVEKREERIAVLEKIGELTAQVQDKTLASLQNMEDIIQEAKFAMERVGGADAELLEAMSKMFTAYQAHVDSLNKIEIMERKFKMQIELKKLDLELKMKLAEHKTRLDIEKKQATQGNLFVQQNFVTFDPQKIVGKVLEVMGNEKRLTSGD